MPYILFLASGSICMSAMNAASFEALYSAFSRMHVQKTWDGIMNAPVTPGQRGAGRDAVGRLQGAVHRHGHPGGDAGPGHQPQPKLLVAWPVLLGVGIMFSSIALIFNALAKGYDFFTYYFTLVLTPMMFLSGVFFPREQLPPLVRAHLGLAAADQRRGAGAPAVHGPVARQQPLRHALVLVVTAGGLLAGAGAEARCLRLAAGGCSAAQRAHYCAGLTLF